MVRRDGRTTSRENLIEEPGPEAGHERSIFVSCFEMVFVFLVLLYQLCKDMVNIFFKGTINVIKKCVLYDNWSLEYQFVVKTIIFYLSGLSLFVAAGHYLNIYFKSSKLEKEMEVMPEILVDPLDAIYTVSEGTSEPKPITVMEGNLEYKVYRNEYLKLDGQELHSTTNEPNCFRLCSSWNGCVSGAYSVKTKKCSLLQSSPYVLELIPYHDEGSKIFIKSSKLEPGVQHADGSFYFLSARCTHAESKECCTRINPMSHPAVLAASNSTLDVARDLYDKILKKSPSKNSVRVLFYDISSFLSSGDLSSEDMAETAQAARDNRSDLRYCEYGPNGLKYLDEAGNQEDSMMLCQLDPIMRNGLSLLIKVLSTSFK